MELATQPLGHTDTTWTVGCNTILNHKWLSSLPPSLSQSPAACLHAAHSAEVNDTRRTNERKLQILSLEDAQVLPPSASQLHVYVSQQPPISVRLGCVVIGLLTGQTISPAIIYIVKWHLTPSARMEETHIVNVLHCFILLSIHCGFTVIYTKHVDVRMLAEWETLFITTGGVIIH